MNKENPIEQLNPYVPVYQGVIEILVAIGNTTRKMLAYIPKNARESTAGIIILGSNGTTAQSLLDEGTWRNIADTEENKEKLIVFFLEPQNGIWNTNEEYGKFDGDIAYVNAAAKKAAEQIVQISKWEHTLFGYFPRSIICRQHGICRRMFHI